MRRRRFMTYSAVGAAASICPLFSSSVQAEETPSSLSIDSHVHFFPGAGDSHPQSSNAHQATPARLPEQWQQTALPCGVTNAVVIEASANVDANQWLLELAIKHPRILGVIGRLPIGTEGCAALIAHFSKHRRFRGVRLRSDAVLKSIDDAAFMRDIKLLHARDLAIDLIGPTQSAAAIQLTARLPRLRVILEHMAGASITGESPDPVWLNAIAAAARHPGIFLKVSHVIQGGVRGNEIRAERYEGWLRAAWQVFGEHRVIFGSDWPASQAHATYDRIHEVVRLFVHARGEETTRRFFRANAMQAYGLDAPD